MPKFAVGVPPELLKGDARDMQRLRQYLMQLCDALANTINNLDGSNIRPGGLTSASFKNLAVEMVKAAKAEIGRAEIGWAQVQQLEAKVAEICTATIETADINWANILDLTAKIAEISRAEIRDADIDFAQIKDLVANKAIITQGVNGKLYVTDLAVTEANMVSLTTGALMVKGQDGSFYQITVTEDGAVKPVLVEVEGENLANETIPGGKLIENTITARELNVAQIFANEAVMVELTANMGKFADLFANEAVIGQLRTHLIETDYLKVKVGRDEVISAINMTEEDAKIMAKRIEFEGLVTANENFKVLLDGSIEAKNADISGKVTANGGSIGGWNIEQGMLYSGAGANRVALATAEETYALWAGAEASGSAPFRVGKDGSLVAHNADIEGKVKAESGSIGGWSIEPGMLYSGAGTNRVALATADATYALWAGAEVSGSAPFRVMRDGSVYLTRLYVTDENGVAQSSPVNLRTSYWKMDAAYSHSVKTLSVADDVLTIELYNGTSVNFKIADTKAYKDGVSAAINSVTVYSPFVDRVEHPGASSKLMRVYMQAKASNGAASDIASELISAAPVYDVGYNAGYAASESQYTAGTYYKGNGSVVYARGDSVTPTQRTLYVAPTGGATAVTVYDVGSSSTLYKGNGGSWVSRGEAVTAYIKA